MAKHQDTAAFARKECERLQRLKELDLVRLFPEQMVQKVTEALRAMMGTSAALVTIVDESSQWTKAPSSAFELPPSIPRELSFCAHAILSGAPLVVEDTTKDERFFRNPLVTSEPCIRFYAGAPITIGDGFAAGSLCVVDTKPRSVTPAQIAQLEGLAAIVSALVEQQRLTSSHAELSSRLTSQKQLLDYASDAAKLGAWEIDPQQGKLVWSDGMYTIHELEQGTAISVQQLPDFYHPEDRLRAQDWIEHAKNMVIPCEFQARMVGAKGTEKIVRMLALRSVARAAYLIRVKFGRGKNVIDYLANWQRFARQRAQSRLPPAPPRARRNNSFVTRIDWTRINARHYFLPL
jgi:GAF domain-containing protein